MEYTFEQEQAVFLRDRDIMVSAGAGAGKTRVLVSRMAEMIMDPNDPVEVDQFLVMTFTNAAAAEMKDRISEELEKRLQKEPENAYLRKQIRKVKQADISTVHSFCNHLIRTHYSELDIDPSFRIGEEGELFLLRHQAIEEVLEEAYQKGTESFYHFVEAYAPEKNDRVLETMIEDLYSFSRGFPNAAWWYEKNKEEIRKLSNEEEWESCKALTFLFSDAKEEVSDLKQQFDGFVKQVLSEEMWQEEHAGYYEFFSLMAEFLNRLVSQETYDSYYAYLLKTPIPSMPRAKRKGEKWVYHDELQAFCGTIKTKIEDQKTMIFIASGEELRRDSQKLYPLLQEYIALVSRFEEIYFSYKKEKNVYDFDDLEHLALKLLVASYDEDGKAHPSEIARELSEKYRMVFVDEYQDTNLTQETLIEMMMASGKNNLFTVGDVKQSIYRFRQARPDLFIRRKNRYEPLENIEQTSKDKGIAIELRDNFRSAPGVLAFTNEIFSHLMEKNFGGVDYDEKTALRPGKGGPMAEETEISEMLLFIKGSEEETTDLPDDLMLESSMIARRMKELKKQGYEYRDMVVLLRSGTGRMERIAEFLERQGIPVVCENKTGYFHTREISMMMNYLAVVDNVYQDIPMASVMLSSIGGFTEEDLVKIRIILHSPMREHYSLYECIKLYLEKGTEEALKEKIREFLTLLSYFRERKKEEPLSILLWEIYQKTGFYYDVQLLPDGGKRKENLMMFLKKAEDYEKTVYKGLFYFHRFMEQLKSYEMEIGEAGNGQEEENAVRIMTIHKSKGLEFPVVFLSGLTKKFNRMEGRKSVIFHPEMGIGLECVDTENRYHYPFCIKNAIRKAVEKDAIEEELRILYVAMTRAQKKLILTGAVTTKEIEEKRSKHSFFSKRQVQSSMEWILSVMAMHFNPENKTEEFLWFFLRTFLWKELEPDFTKEETEKAFSLGEYIKENIGKADSAPVAKAFAYEYPNREAARWKRKYSVSELKTLSQIPVPGEEETFLTKENAAFEEGEMENLVPDFLKEGKKEMSATTRGTIIHKIMELLPFSRIETKKQLYDQIVQVTKEYPEAQKVSGGWLYQGIERFLFSEIGSIIRQMDREGHLKKELPFTVGLPVSLIDKKAKGKDLVVVQGIIDLCGSKGDAIWLFDYKTDRIEPGQEALLLDRYGSQMIYYKTALEQITGKKVEKIYIYSFALRKFLPFTL